MFKERNLWFMKRYLYTTPGQTGNGQLSLSARPILAGTSYGSDLCAMRRDLPPLFLTHLAPGAMMKPMDRIIILLRGNSQRFLVKLLLK